MKAFDRALEFVFRWEGGEVDDPNDPGGHTKYGISARAYPGLDIGSLTREQAREIYLRDYWAPTCCELIPFALALPLFDMAVNAGPKTAVRCLQRTLGVEDDGKIGAITLGAIQRVGDLERASRDMAVERIAYYAALPGWKHYRKGWTKRTVDAVLEGVRE